MSTLLQMAYLHFLYRNTLYVFGFFLASYLCNFIATCKNIHSVPKSFQQSVSQGNYRTDIYQEGFARHAEITDHQELFSMFLESLFSHCCYMEDYWYLNNHIQRVYIFIVRKSGKTDFKCIRRAGFKKRLTSAFTLVSLYDRLLGMALEKCFFLIDTQFLILKSEVSNICQLSVCNWLFMETFE